MKPVVYIISCREIPTTSSGLSVYKRSNARITSVDEKLGTPHSPQGPRGYTRRFGQPVKSLAITICISAVAFQQADLSSNSWSSFIVPLRSVSAGLRSICLAMPWSACLFLVGVALSTKGPSLNKWRAGPRLPPPNLRVGRPPLR